VSSKGVNGKYVITGLLGFIFLFALALWWFQTRVFFQEFQADTVEIAGTVYPVARWKGVDSNSSPLQLRACFVIDEPFEALPALEPEPLVAPGWFKCFNARVIEENLESGYAKAFIAARNEPPGFDRIIAVFPGGRAYMWRQLNGTIAQ
jgi:Family of unknown function (DUF6446)